MKPPTSQLSKPMGKNVVKIYREIFPLCLFWFNDCCATIVQQKSSSIAKNSSLLNPIPFKRAGIVLGS
jgi:hypothetical protein